jgi:hypothetical protein
MIKEVPTEGYHLCELDKIMISTINQLVSSHNKKELPDTDRLQLKQAIALLRACHKKYLDNDNGLTFRACLNAIEQRLDSVNCVQGTRKV